MSFQHNNMQCSLWVTTLPLSWWDLPAKLDFCFSFYFESWKKKHTFIYSSRMSTSIPVGPRNVRGLLTYLFCSNFAEKSLFVFECWTPSSSRQRSYISGVWFALRLAALWGGGKKIINFGCPWELASKCEDEEESFLRANPGVVPSGQRTQPKGRPASHLSNYVSLNCAYSPCFVLSNKATFFSQCAAGNQSITQSTGSNWWRG